MYSPLTRARLRIACALTFGSTALNALLAQATPPAAASELHHALNRTEDRWRTLIATAAVDVRDAQGNTPLHIAALRENADAVDALLKRGADANALNLAKATPLHYGCGSERIVRTLLKHGARPNVVSTAGVTPVMGAAIHSKSAAIVRLLIEAGADVNAIIPERKVTVLAQAVFGGDRESVRLLLEHGAKPDAGEGFLPLAVAAYTGDIEIVRLLLERGAAVNARNPYTGHALNAAFFAGQDAAAALLIERGADVNLKTQMGHGTPPMVFAAYNESGSLMIAEVLKARGADLSAANDLGETALSYALKRGPDTPLVRYLRKAGATPPAASSRQKAVPSRSLPASPASRIMLARESAQRAVDVLQHGSRGFLENGFVRGEKCISCHQQSLPAVAFGLARDRGLRVDQNELGRQLHAQMVLMWGPSAEAARQMHHDPIPVPPDSVGFGADALAALQYAADDTTDALVHYLLRVQRPDGKWVAERRPPMQDGALSATAWAVRAVQLFPPSGERERVADCVTRARDWLTRQQPATHNERVFQLLGLAWSGDHRSQLEPYAQHIISQQRSDGGWSQLPGLDADAWATGSALVALHKAGVPVSHASYQRGVDFLLRTQFDDGSWWVRSRTWPFQPHFDGQFPHGKDQWISAGATAWATMALLLTFEPNVPLETLPDGQTLIARFIAQSAEQVAQSEVTSTANSDAAAVTFARNIRPLVERSCADCHTGEKLKGGFSLATRETILKGGQSGDPAVVPGRSAESHLLRYISDQVEDLEMPPLRHREKYAALSQDEVALVRTWIDSGATWGEAP